MKPIHGHTGSIEATRSGQEALLEKTKNAGPEFAAQSLRSERNRGEDCTAHKLPRDFSCDSAELRQASDPSSPAGLRFT